MKKIYMIGLAAMTAFLGFTSCDEVDLPPIPADVVTDFSNVEIEEKNDLEIPLKPNDTPMIKNYGLYSYDDIEYARQQLAAGKEPWVSAKQALNDNWHSNNPWTPTPTEWLVRGGTLNNYMTAAHNVAAAYQHALRFLMGDGDEYGIAAIEILRAWMNTCTLVTGDTNQALGAGLYGYEFAVAGCMMRDFWEKRNPGEFAQYQDWLVKVFYSSCTQFLKEHFGTPAGHYWANWGLCNVACIIAVGICSDRRDIYNEGIEHFQIGETNGNINKAIYHAFTEDEFDGLYTNFAQWQENGRDIGHSMLCQGLLGVICQLTWGQGDDFFGYGDNRFLKGCEYHGRWLTAGEYVPFVPCTRVYNNAWGVATDVMLDHVERGDAKGEGSIWSIPYNHYRYIKGIDDERIKYTTMGRQLCQIETGGNGGVSGGYDMLGFATLVLTRE